LYIRKPKIDENTTMLVHGYNVYFKYIERLPNAYFNDSSPWSFYRGELTAPAERGDSYTKVPVTFETVGNGLLLDWNKSFPRIEIETETSYGVYQVVYWYMDFETNNVIIGYMGQQGEVENITLSGGGVS
jgi:hypothetical protein